MCEFAGFGLTRPHYLGGKIGQELTKLEIIPRSRPYPQTTPAPPNPRQLKQHAFPENLCMIFLSLLFNGHHLRFMCRFQEGPRNDYTGCKGQGTGQGTGSLELTWPPAGGRGGCKRVPPRPKGRQGGPQNQTHAETHLQPPAPSPAAGEENKYLGLGLTPQGHR